MLDPASPQALDALADAPAPPSAQQQQQPQPEEQTVLPDSLLSAEHSAASAGSSGTAEPGAEAGGLAGEEQGSPLLSRQAFQQGSTSPLWRAQQQEGQQQDGDGAEAAAAEAAQPAPAAFSPGPLQGALLQQLQQQPVAAPAALEPLNRSASGPFVTARSKLSGGEEAAADEEGEEGEEENASPGTEPLRCDVLCAPGCGVASCVEPSAWNGSRSTQTSADSGLHTCSTPRRYSLAKPPSAQQQEQPLAAAAGAAGLASLLAAPGAGPKPFMLQQPQPQLVGVYSAQVESGVLPPGVPAAAAAAAAAKPGQLGGKAEEAAAWQPYGLWQQQKERLLQTQGQEGRAGSGIPARWQQQAAQQKEIEAAEEEEGQQVQREQPAGDPSPFTQHSSTGGLALHPAVLAAAAEAAAGSSSPMAKSVRAAGSVPQSPVRYSPASLRQRQRCLQPPPHSPEPVASGAAAAAAGVSVPASPGQAPGAALFAAAAVAAAASPVQAPVVEPPSPAQYSPESLRYRQQQGLPQLRVPTTAAARAAAAAVAAAEQEAAAAAAEEMGGHYSPGSLRQRQAAAAQKLAMSQLQLQRLLSEQQADMARHAAEAAAEVEGHPPEGLQAAPPAAPTPASRFAPAQQQPAATPASAMGSVAGAGQPYHTPLGQPMDAAASAALISARLAQAEQVRTAAEGAGEAAVAKPSFLLLLEA